MQRLNQTLSELAREIPGATAVFHRHQLDFCCGGAQTLRQAALKRGLDAEAIDAELAGLEDRGVDTTNWTDKADAELIEHILSRYHDTHRRQLPELIRLAKRVELVHGGHPACPAGLTAHLEKMRGELEAHMRKEEEILFPMITHGMGRAALRPIAVMRHEHEEHGAALNMINQITRNITPPEGACNTWRALYTGLAELVTDLMDHIHLENNVLFERIDAHSREVQHG